MVISLSRTMYPQEVLGAKVSASTWTETWLRPAIRIRSCGRTDPKRSTALTAVLLTQFAACFYSAPSAADTSVSSSNELQEVTVTARRREESLVKIPESITVFSQQQIQDLNIQDLVDYATKTPNLSFAYGVTTTGFFSRAIAIRGISGANTTAVYLDDTPLTQSFDPRVLDIERIEVLKGPQGSLFGADSMGGAVRLVSVQPDLTGNSYREMAQGGVTSGGGSADYGVQSGANLVLMPDVAATRAVVFYQHDAGFLTRVFPEAENPSRLQSVNDQGETLNYGFALTTLVRPLPDLDITLRLFNQTTNLPKGWPATTAPLPGFEPAYTREEPTDLAGLAYTQVWLPSLAVTYKQKNWSISSSTSYYQLVSHEVEASQLGSIQAFEQFFSIPPPANIPPWAEQHYEWQFTQELRLAFEDIYRFSGVVGLYYNDLRRENLFPPLIYTGLTDLGIGATTDNFYNETDRYRDTEEAAYGELNYHLTDRLTLTAGGREYHLTDSTHILADGFFNGGLSVAAPPNEVDTGFSPKVAASYQVGATENVYASWAKGFRPGGGNQALPSFCDSDLATLGLTQESALTYHPDTVRTSELGGKGEFAENRIYASVAVFQTDWLGVQQVVNLPTCGYQVRTNAGAGRIRGGELELNGKVTEGLEVDLGAGYEDARVTEAGGGNFLVGERLQEVPEVTATLRGTYRFPISGQMGGLVSADVNYTGNSLSGNTTPATPLTRPAYTLTNARIGVEWPKSSLVLYVNNIGNVHANLADLRFIGFNETSVNSAGETVPLPRVVVLTPIQVGLQYRVNF